MFEFETELSVKIPLKFNSSIVTKVTNVVDFHIVLNMIIYGINFVKSQYKDSFLNELKEKHTNDINKLILLCADYNKNYIVEVLSQTHPEWLRCLEQSDNFKFDYPMVKFEDCEKPFHIGKYLVTQQQWFEIMGNNPSYFQGNTHNHPVENVSWDDCQEFIKKLNKKTGKNYRLPTEYEWILCATINNTIYSGSNDIDEVAWYNKNSSNQTHPVGLKKPNSLDIYDMTGNIWEWCNDKIKDQFYVLHGGSWYCNDYICHISYRYWHVELNRNNSFGFRLAHD